MRTADEPVTGIEADGPKDNQHQIAVLVLAYHFGRMVMACQVLGSDRRVALATATERARANAEDLCGSPSTGPLNLGHVVDDRALRNVAVSLARQFMKGSLRDAVAIESAVTQGATLGVLKHDGLAAGSEQIAA